MTSEHSVIDSPSVSETPLYSTADNGVVRVVLDRPKSINALSEEMLLALQACLDDIAKASSIKAVILASSGAHFCAGHNLKEMTARRADADGGKAYFVELFETCSRLMKTIVRLPQPVIAEVRGVATAAGCQLVAACDLAVAADTARFATSGVNFGLFCSTPMVALSRNVARKQAMEMLLLGEFLPAQRVAAMGLVNAVVPEDQVAGEAMRMGRIIADKSSAAVKIGKETFYRQAEMTLDDAYQHAGWAMAENMMARDAKAGIGAFVNKQPTPDWTGE
jgi:enoyl-CoA hydratase/carnithine racemase